MFQLLEKAIIRKLRAIERGEMTTSESGVAKLLNQMREVDEPCYEELMDRYMKAISK